MIRFLKHNQIDKSLWDDTIRESKNGIIYAYSWYLDIVCEGWEALVDDDYSSVMPLTKGRKYRMDYIYPPFFTQQSGVFSKYPLNEYLCNSFLSAIPDKFRFIEMNLNISHKWYPRSFTERKNSNYILKLGRNYNEIRNNYSENHQRNIKKANKNQLTIFKSGAVNDIITMFRNNRGQHVINLKDDHYLIFSRLQAEAHKRNMSNVWIVNNQYGLPVAGAVFLVSHHSAIFIFSAVTSEGRSLSAMHFLIDEFIRENSLLLNTLDFEGSNDPELARFYRGFGSTEFVYLQIKRNQLPLPWKWFKN